MTSALVPPTPPTLREKQILLTALVKDVMNSSGQDSLHIPDDGDSFFVYRMPKPVVTPLDAWPGHVPPEEVAELDRRLATIDDADLLFEFTLPANQVPPGEPQGS